MTSELLKYLNEQMSVFLNVKKKKKKKKKKKMKLAKNINKGFLNKNLFA